jgi:hypothetical protein
MAYGITLLGITGIGIIWILRLLKKECDGRNKERSLVQFLAEEIKNLRKDVNNLKK